MFQSTTHQTLIDLRLSFDRKNTIFLIVSVILFLLALLIFMHTRSAAHLKLLISSDAEGYFQYLPYFFIKGEMHKLPYAREIFNGNTLNIYHVGVAILQLPFFLLAHAFASITSYPATGYSHLYSILLSASFYGALASFFMLKVVSRHFSTLVSVVTILCLIFGTNLIYYTSFEPGMSHIYSLFLMSCFIYQVGVFLDRPTFRTGMFLGLTLGLITVVRPSNLLICAVPDFGRYTFIGWAKGTDFTGAQEQIPTVVSRNNFCAAFTPSASLLARGNR